MQKKKVFRLVLENLIKLRIDLAFLIY
jgi:hypothetical protein